MLSCDISYFMFESVSEIYSTYKINLVSMASFYILIAEIVFTDMSVDFSGFGNVTVSLYFFSDKDCI